MFVLGITGPTASGKSTLLGFFRDLGLATVSVDELYRDLTRPHSSLVRAIAQQLGPRFISPDGSLDRRRLAAAVFSDPELLRQLNQVTHPPLLRALEERLHHLRTSGNSDVVAVEAAVLEEMGALRLVDGLVYVDVDEETQLSRLLAEGLREEEARARIRAQDSIRRSAEKARWHADGGESLKRLREVSRRILGEIRSGTEGPRERSELGPS